MLREQANAALVAEQKHLHIARPSGDERVNGCSLEAHCTHLRPFMSSAAAGGVSRHGRPLDTPRLPAQPSGRTENHHGLRSRLQAEKLAADAQKTDSHWG